MSARERRKGREGQSLFAIDPGPVQSAWVHIYDGEICDKGIEENDSLAIRLRMETLPYDTLVVIEMIASYGMPVGKEVFETCVWIGRFLESWPGDVERIFRSEVKQALCKDSRAKDSNIRKALIDRYGPPGTKKAPGFLYGVKKDIWAALAVAEAWKEKSSQIDGKGPQD